MSNYQKLGYLNHDFKMFHLVDHGLKQFEYHYHDFHKIIIFIKGNAGYSIEGKNYQLQPYDIILVKHGEIHKPIVYDDSEYERIIIYIAPNFLEDYKEEEYDLGYCFQKAGEEHASVLRINSFDKSKLYRASLELEQSFHDCGYASELHRKLLFLEFMIHLNRSILENHMEYIGTQVDNSKIVPVIEYINLHLTEDLSIEELSSKFFLSKYYMMRLFKEKTGYTIGSYITNKRLFYAKQLVLKGVPITQACYDCGFKNYSTFSRAYKKLFADVPKNLKDKYD